MRNSIAEAVAGSKRKIALLIFIILSELRHRLHSRCPRNPGNKSFNCITTAGSNRQFQRTNEKWHGRKNLIKLRNHLCALPVWGRLTNRVSRPPWHAMIKIHLPSFSCANVTHVAGAEPSSRQWLGCAFTRDWFLVGISFVMLPLISNMGYWD